jgi:hypothetical protein
MSSLAVLVSSWELNERAIAANTQAMKELAAEKLKLETDLIPSLMASAGGIDKFTLEDGTAITIKDELYASITQARQQEAFAWLEAHGHGDVIKDEMKLSLGRGEVAQLRAAAMIIAAEQNGINDYSRKRAVHPGTLAALIREQLGEGVEVPKETFGVHQQRRAVIKLAKA